MKKNLFKHCTLYTVYKSFLVQYFDYERFLRDVALY